jgi:hypothetical protein
MIYNEQGTNAGKTKENNELTQNTWNDMRYSGRLIILCSINDIHLEVIIVKSCYLIS